MVVRSRVISRVTILLTHIRGLITPLITTHEPPSTALLGPPVPRAQPDVVETLVPLKPADEESLEREGFTIEAIGPQNPILLPRVTDVLEQKGYDSKAT